MTTTDKAALLRRAAERMACPEGASCPHPDCRQGNADSAALTAWAAEMEAADKWLDAPDGPGEWWGEAPQGSALVLMVKHDTVLWLDARSPMGIGWSGLTAFLATRPGWRYRRRTPVIVPPREVTP